MQQSSTASNCSTFFFILSISLPLCPGWLGCPARSVKITLICYFFPYATFLASVEKSNSVIFLQRQTVIVRVWLILAIVHTFTLPQLLHLLAILIIFITPLLFIFSGKPTAIVWGLAAPCEDVGLHEKIKMQEA